MDKKCLFIDDEPEDVKNVLDNLAHKGKLKGLNIECHLFGLKSGYYDENGDYDRKSIEQSLHNDYMDKHKFDLVACDFDLEDDKFNGLDVVSLVRLKNRNCAVVLYSGNLKKIANYIAETKDQGERFKRIKSIVNGKIEEFIDRSNDYEDQMIYILKSKIPLEVTIEKKLLEHKDMEFKHGYDKFKGKTLGEIAHEIETGSHHGEKFKRELIERGIAHMIELNN